MATGMKKPAVKSRKPKTVALTMPIHNDHLHAYAVAGVVVMSVLSAMLNGYANSLHATIPWAGWMMGLTIPAIILLLGKVAGILHVHGVKRLAYVTASSGIG